MSSKLGLSNRQLRLLGGLVILAATFASYWPALSGQFIWDDDRHVSQNRTLLDLKGLRRIWFAWGATPQYYPMTHTSFWIEYRFWRSNPIGYHASNVALHSLNAILLWAVLRRLGVAGAWVVAILFSLHPINVESVAWISERKNLLAMCFALLSMLAYLRGTRRGYAWSVVLFAAALLSKTVVASLPAVLLVITCWRQQRIIRRDLLKTAPMFVMGIGMGLMTVVMERRYVGASGPDWPGKLIDRVLIASRAICFYVGKIFWPIKLTFSYPKWDIDAQQPWQWIFPAAVVLAFAGLILVRKRLGGGILAAGLIFAGTLFPALGFFNTYPMRYSYVADHFAYFSVPSLLAVVVVGGHRILQSLPRMHLISTAILLGVLAGLTLRQSRIYAGPQTIWRDTIEKNPLSWMARYNLGLILLRQADADSDRTDPQTRRRDLEQSLALFDQVKLLRPQHPNLDRDRADVLARLGRADQALAIYDAALSANPADISAMVRRSRLLDQMGRVDDAVAGYEQALRIRPDDADIQLETGLLLSRRQRPAQAVGHLERYVQLKPDDAQGHATLGFVYGELGRFEDARRQFNRAMDLDPESARVQQGLELLRRATGR